MVEDTQNTDTQAEGMAALGAISADAPVAETAYNLRQDNL